MRGAGFRLGRGIGVTKRVEPTTDASPRDEYRRRLDARRQTLARSTRKEGWIANARLLVLILALIQAWFVFGTTAMAPLWLLVPVLAFIALVLIHEPFRRAVHRASRAVVFYEKG